MRVVLQGPRRSALAGVAVVFRPQANRREHPHSPNSRPPVSLPAIRQSVHEPALEGRNISRLTRSALDRGMRIAVLRLTGHNFETGGGE